LGFINYLRSSLALTQAVIALLLSVVISIAVTGFSINKHFHQQREQAVNLAQEILTAAEGGATNAVWTLDPELANRVISSVTALGMVQDGMLANENGDILAQVQKPVEPTNASVEWIITHFMGEQLQTRRDLFIIEDNNKRTIGVLSIKLNLVPLAQDFVSFSVSLAITGLLQAICIALVLLLLSSWLLTSPLKRITQSIANIEPNKPDGSMLADAAVYSKNEMGQLISHINQMLQGLIDAQVQLRQLATRDPLTGRLNRTLITDRLSQAIVNAQRDNEKVAVLFIDMDRFKNINDSLGHDVGDVLLVEVAKRLVEVLRCNDSVGRLGGDEFLVVIEGASDLDHVVQAVKRIDYALSQPYFLNGREVRSSGSIGISMYPDNGRDATKLMRCADLAMYEAKSSINQWSFFAKEMSHKVEVRLRIEEALLYALERNEFHLNYQPKISRKTGQLVGCEALIRWNKNPEPISVEGFIKIAESSGSIIEIGQWVLETACQQIKDWEEKFGGICVAINVSARQMQENDYVERVLSTVKKYGIKPEHLELEITETVLMKALDKSFAALKRLREHGIHVSIDDFGTGYCSLSYLSQLPVDTLKIDRSFVSGNQPSIAVLEMIVAMAKALGLKTVAEGVETKQQQDWLVDEGCDYLQGYLFSKPVASQVLESEFLQPLKTQN
jgi:c-di-GMP phosphodiesterase